jgi:hypothetical protein
MSNIYLILNESLSKDAKELCRGGYKSRYGLKMMLCILSLKADGAIRNALSIFDRVVFLWY